MSNFEKKEQNLNQLIDKLNSLSLSYSQPNYELEKIRTEKNELANQKKKIEKKNEELTREHKYLKEKIKKFREDELHHKDIAYDNGATKKGLFGVLDKVIKTSSRIAITISEKI